MHLMNSVAIEAGRETEIESKEGKLFLNGDQVISINSARMSVGKAMSKRNKVLYKFILGDNKC